MWEGDLGALPPAWVPGPQVQAPSLLTCPALGPPPGAQASPQPVLFLKLCALPGAAPTLQHDPRPGASVPTVSPAAEAVRAPSVFCNRFLSSSSSIFFVCLLLLLSLSVNP